MVIRPPGIKEADILSSVHSTGIQKVTLVYRFFPSLAQQGIDWEIFDGPLRRLVDQLRCTHRLEVDFRIIAERGVTETDEVERFVDEILTVVDALAGFREKGQIRIFWVVQGESVEVYPADIDY